MSTPDAQKATKKINSLTEKTAQTKPSIDPTGGEFRAWHPTFGGGIRMAPGFRPEADGGLHYERSCPELGTPGTWQDWPYEDELLAIFGMIDDDGNGVMHFSELLDLGKGVSPSFTAEKCRAVLGWRDEDHNGTITKEEFVEFFRKMMKNHSPVESDRGIVQARTACKTIDTDTCGDMHSDMVTMLGDMHAGMHNDHMACNVTTCMTACTARCISTCMTPCTTTSPPTCMKHVDRKPVMLQVKKVAESVARKKAMLRREGQARHACPQPPPVVVADMPGEPHMS